MNDLQTLSVHENTGSEHAIGDSSEESEWEESKGEEKESANDTAAKEPIIFPRNSSTSSLGQHKSLLIALFNQNGNAKSTPAESSEESQPLSAGTTRKNMIHSEMTETLRVCIYKDRESKKSTIQAVLKRSPTAHVVLEHSGGEYKGNWSVFRDCSTRGR